MQSFNKLTVNLAAKTRTFFKTSSSRAWVRCRSTVEKPPGVRSRDVSSEFTIPQGIFGQPTCHTHPHLIQPGHLTCGISQTEYKERRETLVNKLISEKENIHRNHIIVIPGARKQYMSDKIPYVFRQNSDFFYLTGCLEPSAILVMIKPAQTENYKSILFVHDKDAHAELWEGPRTGCAAAAKLFAVDEARPVENFPAFINRTISSSRPAMVWYNDDSICEESVTQAVTAALKNGQVASGSPQRELHFMRVRKSPAEIELMEDVCYIGAQTLNMAMACTKPGVSEQQVSAVLEYSGKQSGAEHAAFPPVVAGGPRATHIHYVSNNQLLAQDDLLTGLTLRGIVGKAKNQRVYCAIVDLEKAYDRMARNELWSALSIHEVSPSLIQALKSLYMDSSACVSINGCQRWMYNSDISRTWPVSGQFSPHHRVLYELVLAVQKRLIEILGDHRPALDQLFDSMCRLLGTYLQQEGILPKNIDGNELIGRAYRLCPHHVSHYLGLDVHDAPLVRRAAPVLPGMIVTVEPGIYIRPDDESVPAEFRGIGIRVEDDVLVTESGPRILTSAAVSEPADIEALVGKHAV